jgi:hypothetical protein
MSDEENIAAVRAMLALARVTAKPSLRSASFRDVGTYLGRLRHGRSKIEWADLVECNCGLSVRRAYQLVSIAAGKKPLAELRSETAARARKHYSKQSKGSIPNPSAEVDFSVPVAAKKLNEINPNARGRKPGTATQIDNQDRTCPHCGWPIPSGVVKCRVCEVAKAAKRLARRRAAEERKPHDDR